MVIVARQIDQFCAPRVISDEMPLTRSYRQALFRCICKLVVACGRLSAGCLLSDFVGEPVAGCLPGHAERDRDPVPAASSGAGGLFDLGVCVLHEITLA
jgi:hypothetical protein